VRDDILPLCNCGLVCYMLFHLFKCPIQLWPGSFAVVYVCDVTPHPYPFLPPKQGHLFGYESKAHKVKSSQVRDFLLVRHSKLGPIVSRFRDIAGFLLRNWPPLDQIAVVGAKQNIKLISREIIFVVFQPMCTVLLVPQRYTPATTNLCSAVRRSDRRTDVRRTVR